MHMTIETADRSILQTKQEKLDFDSAVLSWQMKRRIWTSTYLLEPTMSRSGGLWTNAALKRDCMCVEYYMLSVGDIHSKAPSGQFGGQKETQSNLPGRLLSQIKPKGHRRQRGTLQTNKGA
jgi:hypothetical protein